MMSNAIINEYYDLNGIISVIGESSQCKVKVSKRSIGTTVFSVEYSVGKKEFVNSGSGGSNVESDLLNILKESFALTLKIDTINQLMTREKSVMISLEGNEEHGYLGSVRKHCILSSDSVRVMAVVDLTSFGRLKSVLTYNELVKLYSCCTFFWLMCADVKHTFRERVHLLMWYVQTHLSHKEIDEIFSKSEGVIDTGSLFYLMCKDWIALNKEFATGSLAGRSSLVDQSTVSLEQGIVSGEHAALGPAIISLINRRDSKVSWYLGQLLIDLPYSRSDLRKALSIDDTKTRRDQSFLVIKQFDARVERENAVRVADQIRESWFSNKAAIRPVIVVGRESRAFSNQATLFASANYVELSPDVIISAREIIKQLSVDEFTSQYRSEMGGDVELFGMSEEILAKVVPVLQHFNPVVGRLKLLLSSVNENCTSVTQFQGTMQQLREVLIIVYQKVTGIIEEFQKQLLNTFAEGISRKLNHSVFKGFRTLYQFVETQYGRSQSMLWYHIYQMEEQLHGSSAESVYPSSYSVLLQRPSQSGSERFKTNELESKPEQEESLQKLVRIGGKNLYMSPTNDWVIQATDLIEAVPLFIYERTLEIDGKVTTIFEVDQEGLEQTIRSLAEQWCQNIQLHITSEHISLAREIVLNSNQRWVEEYKNLLDQGIIEENASRIILKNHSQIQQIVDTTIFLESEYNQLAEKVELNVEKNWKESRFINRAESLKSLLLEKYKHNYPLILEQVKSHQLPKPLSDERKKTLEFMALKRQRKMPAFHLLTTEAPGLVEGFIQAVLEEEMALKNIIEHYQLEGLVEQKLQSYKKILSQLGAQVIKEFSYEPVVEQYASQLNLSIPRAQDRVIADNIILQKQVSLLAVLYEMDQLEGRVSQGHLDKTSPYVPHGIDKMIIEFHEEIQRKSLDYIYQENKSDLLQLQSPSDGASYSPVEILKAIESNDILKSEYSQSIQWEARFKLFESYRDKYQNLYLQSRFDKYYRNRTALSLTNARREVVSDQKLFGELINPRFAFSCGGMFVDEMEQLRPTGVRKRYHFVYGPSRVNLGKDERKSVEIWPQFVGVTDPLGAKHAKEFYSLMNYNPIIRTITAAENLKVSENQWTALVRSIRNVQALFVERLAVGDIEDLAYQFNQRGGLAMANQKEGEGYMSGPTAGYCIPKDLLFKLFVVTHQDSRKLSMLGIASHLHESIIQFMVKISAKQHDFETSIEWEKWAINQLVEHFHEKKEVSDHLAKFIEISGGQVLLHFSKLVQILGFMGMPSPFIPSNKDLHSSLWSSWAERKITLGGEQVNRSVVFPMTREIPESAKLAKKLNPLHHNLPSERELRVHMFGVYKGDDDQKPPPDVRFSWVMRAFLILSGHYHEVALSLDEEGQVIARLGWIGFHPDSKDPQDVKVREYLARVYLNKDDFDRSNKNDEQWLIKLTEKFPQHSTVGDITITAVHGVDSEDLLGFSAETLHLLGNEATKAMEYLKSKGISFDQMKSNAQLHRKFIEEWVPLSNLPEPEKRAILSEVGGKIHPLSLRLRGPGDNFYKDLQGQDVVIFSITHPQLLAMDPSTLSKLMMVGRPNSSLVAHDHVSQGRHRCWFDRDIMLWYASGLSYDSEGKKILDWRRRKSSGRRSIYKAFGLGEDSYQPMVGTDLRVEVFRLEERAMNVYDIFNHIYIELNAKPSDKDSIQKIIDETNHKLFNEYNGLISIRQLSKEIDLHIQYEQRVLLANRYKKRDLVIREALEYIVEHHSIKSFKPIHWLAIGGFLLLNGYNKDYQSRKLCLIQKVNDLLQAEKPVTTHQQVSSLNTLIHDNELINELIVQELSSSNLQLTDRKGKMFSVKASEEHIEVAVARRKELQLQSKRNQIIKWKVAGYHDVDKSISQFKDLKSIITSIQIPIESNLVTLTCMIKNDSQELEHVNKIVGQTLHLIIKLLKSIVNQTIEDSDQNKSLQETISVLINETCELQIKIWDELVGTYEEFGKITSIYESCQKSGQTEIYRILPFALNLLFLLDKSNQYLSLQKEDIQERELWRSLAEFFAKTLDDHYCEYTPWTLDPKRYPIFSEYFDSVGIMKPEFCEEQYEVYWSIHRTLYPFIRSLIICKSSTLTVDNTQQQLSLLLGDTYISEDMKNDKIQVQAIGASACNAHWETLWRSYNQLREVAFIKNDGFNLPRVFVQPMDPNEILDASNRVNHVYLSPVGRTHYASSLTEGPTLGDNLFITRDGTIIESNGRKVLTISDGYIWVSESQYEKALLKVQEFSEGACKSQIYSDKSKKRLTEKGIYIACRFTKPVIVGSVITLHHHHLESEISKSGYPTTDKSPFLYELTYNKSLYPLIFNPPEKTLVNLPQEIDWLQVETLNSLKPDVLKNIKLRLMPFIQMYPTIIVKGAAESGARNLSRFDFPMEGSTLSDGVTTRDQVIEKAVDFIYHISRSQNVVIQRAIISSPLFWMNSRTIKKLVERQILDYGIAVELNQYPKDSVYGTVRIILSSSMPNPNDMQYPDTWQCSHPIALNSLQIATNVGRQGSLDMLTKDMITDNLSEIFMKQLESSGKQVMSAMARFDPTYWSKDIELYGQKISSYHHRFPNIKEKDATGVPIWWPRYLMLDFIPEPVWKNKETGEIVDASHTKLLDIVLSDKDTETIFLLKDLNSNQEFHGEVVDIKFWHLEPNVGVGLWTNYWKREIESLKYKDPKDGQIHIPWTKIGSQDRIVLSNFLEVGKQFKATLPTVVKDHINDIKLENQVVPFIPIDQHHGRNTSVSESQVPEQHKKTQNELTDLLKASDIEKYKEKPLDFIEYGTQLLGSKSSNQQYLRRLVEIHFDDCQSHRITPEIILHPSPLSDQEFKELMPYNNTFAVVTGKRSQMNQHFYPFFTSFQNRLTTYKDLPLNVIGIHESWLEFLGSGRYRIQRCQILSKNDKIWEIELTETQSNQLKLRSSILLELLTDELNQETNHHLELQLKLENSNIKVLNDYFLSREKCDDKYWFKCNLLNLFPSEDYSHYMQIPEICLLEKSKILTKEDALVILKQSKVLEASKSTGIAIQPRCNTTESDKVEYYQSKDINKAIDRILELQDHEGYGDFIVTQFIPSVKPKHSDRSFVIRINSCIGDKNTIAIVEAGSDDETIISPGLRKSKFSLVINILDDLEFQFKRCDFVRLSNIANKIRMESGLPIVGIDVLLTPSSDTDYKFVVLESNSRPGSLIMSEQLHFNSETGLIESISISTPISNEFWNLVMRSSHQTIDDIQTNILTDQKLFNEIFSSRYQYSNDNREGCEYRLKDRQDQLLSLCRDAVTQHHFEKNEKCSIVASNGRNRIFMGHSDLPGLGGCTINSNSINEIISIAQVCKSRDKTTNGKIFITNSNSLYPAHTIDIIEDILPELQKCSKNETVWSQSDWQNYIKASIAYILSKQEQFPVQTVNDLLQLKESERCIRVHFGNSGNLQLPLIGGVSSSSALTGAFTLAMNSALTWRLSKEQLSMIDFGEYYLGKSAGASDKTSQLFSKKEEISVIGSFPERFIKTLKFPNEVVVIIAGSNIPRLCSSEGSKWIKNQIQSHYIKTSECSEEEILKWPQSVLDSFGSKVFIESINHIQNQFTNNQAQSMKQTGLSKSEMEKLLICLSPAANPLSSGGLFRELSYSGEIEKQFPECSNNRFKRYVLIYKLLKILPEEIEINGLKLYMRKSVLYGLSELERGAVYQAIMSLLNLPIDPRTKDLLVSDLMRVVKAAHDGDKQTVDYRNGFKLTDWGESERESYSDVVIDGWIEATQKHNKFNTSKHHQTSLIQYYYDNFTSSFLSFNKEQTTTSTTSSSTHQQPNLSMTTSSNHIQQIDLIPMDNPLIELSLKTGGFQRSLPEFDQEADEFYQLFNGEAALRVSAAGLGGNLCVHTHSKHLVGVLAYLESKNYKISILTHHGPPSQSLF